MQRTSCLVLLTLLCAAVVVSGYPVRDEGSCARRRHRQQHHDEYEQYGHDEHDEHERYGHDGPYAELKKSDTDAQARVVTSAEAVGHHAVHCVLDAQYSSSTIATSNPSSAATPCLCAKHHHCIVHRAQHRPRGPSRVMWHPQSSPARKQRSSSPLLRLLSSLQLQQPASLPTICMESNTRACRRHCGVQ